MTRKLTPAQQRAEIVSTERHFSADAFRDSRDSMAATHTDFKNGNFILGNWHRNEGNVDAYWGNRRLGIVRKNEK